MTEKSCENCIYKISSITTPHQVNLGIGNDLCAKKNRIISNNLHTEAVNKKTQVQIAKQCDSWNNESDGSDIKYESLGIHLGIPVNRETLKKNNEPQVNSCAFCNYCKHADSSTSVELGVDTMMPVCSALGFAIVPGGGIEFARECLIGTPRNDDSPPVTLNSIELFEDMIVEVEIEKPNVNDPLDYETDAPVKPEDKELGIRAWELIKDPTGYGPSIHMPIFDPDHFTEDERKNIPRPGDDEHPELYIDHLGLLYKMLGIWKIGQTPSLSGVSGVGKTEIFRHIAYRMQLPFERVSINDATDIDELAGHTLFSKETGTYFVKGVVTRAWEKPCVMVIDEPNVGPSEVWQFIRPLTDNSKQLVLNMNKGEKVPRNNHCYFGMAMNPAWDMRNVGTHEIGDADARRLMHIFVPPPDEATEKQIVMERCAVDNYKLPERTYKTIQAISKQIRTLCSDDQLPIQWGTAQVIKVARATEYFKIADCFRLAIVDFIDPDSGEMIMSQVRSMIR